MSQAKTLNEVKLESIFHPSDFSEASEVAFVHALKIALVARANLQCFMSRRGPVPIGMTFQAVRDTLERWGLIPKGSPKSAVGQLALRPLKFLEVEQRSGKSLSWLSGRESYESDRVGVRQHEGRMRWLEKSVAGRLRVGLDK